MGVHLSREIENLKKKVLALGAVAEDSVRKAVRAVESRDRELAASVINSDLDIDRCEVDIEEDCLKILALHQPVAADLRLIVAVLKINSDLERIGDLSVNIAERATFLAAQPPIPSPFDLHTMASKAQNMLKGSLDAVVTADAELANNVLAADDEVDSMNRRMYDLTKDAMRQNSRNVDSLVHFLCVSNHLERIADHATNIAEDVIYMVEGKIVRHNPEDYTSDKKSP